MAAAPASRSPPPAQPERGVTRARRTPPPPGGRGRSRAVAGGGRSGRWTHPGSRCAHPDVTTTQIRPAQPRGSRRGRRPRSEEHTSELQSPCNLVCRLLLEKKKKIKQ